MDLIVGKVYFCTFGRETDAYMLEKIVLWQSTKLKRYHFFRLSTLETVRQDEEHIDEWGWRVYSKRKDAQEALDVEYREILLGWESKFSSKELFIKTLYDTWSSCEGLASQLDVGGQHIIRFKREILKERILEYLGVQVE